MTDLLHLLRCQKWIWDSIFFGMDICIDIVPFVCFSWNELCAIIYFFVLVVRVHFYIYDLIYIWFKQEDIFGKVAIVIIEKSKKKKSWTVLQG
jgi:hypothetical protein